MYLAADKLRTPAVRAVAEIASHLGGPARVARIRAVPFPGAVWQLSEYVAVPASPDRPATVVAMYLKGGKPEHWTPVEGGFDAAVARFQEMAEQAREIEAAAAAAQEPAMPAPGVTLPPPPPGVRIKLPATGRTVLTVRPSAGGRF